jgi:hypothetical protein
MVVMVLLHLYLELLKLTLVAAAVVAAILRVLEELGVVAPVQ